MTCGLMYFQSSGCTKVYSFSNRCIGSQACYQNNSPPRNLEAPLVRYPWLSTRSLSTPALFLIFAASLQPDASFPIQSLGHVPGIRTLTQFSTVGNNDTASPLTCVEYCLDSPQPKFSHHTAPSSYRPDPYLTFNIPLFREIIKN